MKKSKILVVMIGLVLAACDSNTIAEDPEVVEVDDECPTADGTPCQ